MVPTGCFFGDLASPGTSWSNGPLTDGLCSAQERHRTSFWRARSYIRSHFSFRPYSPCLRVWVPPAPSGQLADSCSAVPVADWSYRAAGPEFQGPYPRSESVSPAFHSCSSCPLTLRTQDRRRTCCPDVPPESSLQVLRLDLIGGKG